MTLATFINTLATLPLQHHTELGLVMSALCLLTGMLLVHVWQLAHEPQVAQAFEKAPLWQYVLAELTAPAPCSVERLLREINR